MATTRRVGGSDQPEARFITANTSGEQEAVTFGGLNADEVAILAYDTTGALLVPPVPFKVVVFCPQAAQPSLGGVLRKPVARLGTLGRKGH